jgi:microsomal dipeptidase-like Zn-dependent dipeptidase
MMPRSLKAILILIGLVMAGMGCTIQVQVPPPPTPVVIQPSPAMPTPTPAPPAAPTPTEPPPAMPTPALALVPPVLNPTLIAPIRPTLRGWVDLHTHPMAHLGFGGHLIVGGPDVGSLIPKITCDRQNQPAGSIADALPNSNPTHGGPGLFDNPCGDEIRKQIINQLQSQLGRDLPEKAVGWPTFEHYPAWDAVTHQVMYVDWLRRAVQYGELRVLVALAVNNKTLGDAVRGPGDPLPVEDKQSADLQINEIKQFVERHRDFMEIAYTPADLRRIVGEGKLAVVLGVELDAIGNFYLTRPRPSADVVRREIDRLWDLGVRYIFPVHVIDNAFGGSAIYQELFTVSNYREAGRYFEAQCAAPAQWVTRPWQPGLGLELWAAALVKLGTGLPSIPAPPGCPPGVGHVNPRGMTELGRVAMIHAMSKGMLIDVDHMSDRTLECALRLAEAVPGGYPLISGHTGVRSEGGRNVGENMRHPEQLRRIRDLGGIFGLGTEATTPEEFVSNYRIARTIMGTGRVAIGSDANGLVKLPRPPMRFYFRYDDRFPQPSTGRKTWDYHLDGVAHYGMFADFLRAVQAVDPEVHSSLMSSAEMFAQTWEKAFRVRDAVSGAPFPACP